MSRRFRTIALLALGLVAAMCTAALAAEEGAAPSFGILSLLPPLVAIIMCLVTHEVIPSLFVGSWVAGTMICGWNPIFGFGRTVENLWNNLGDPWGARIILTCVTMSGLVGMMQVSGGVKAAVRALSNKVKSSRTSMLFTELAGLVIFFEDYVTAAVVGTTMSPISDNYRVSKEKLAYLVDSTAAPIAAMAGVSTWVAYMVGQIGTQFNELGIQAGHYTTYLSSIPFMFYNIISLVLVTTVAISARDFGPMLKAEKRARTGKIIADNAQPLAASSGDPDLQPSEGTNCKIMNFVVPVCLLVICIVSMLLITGGFPKVSLKEAMGAANSSKSLCYGSFAATTISMFFYMFQRDVPLARVCRGFLRGGQAVFIGSLILVYAWGLSSGIKSVGTAAYLVNATKDFLSPEWLPLIAFVTGMIISFCTGTSYGTMGILMPIVIPLSYKVSTAAGIDIMTYLVPTIAAVIAGAVWGDHCSPISDTTIMSSMFTGGDHVDHVKTQIPYAILGGLGAILAYAGIGFGISPMLSLLGAAVAVVIVFMLVSKPVEQYIPSKDQA